MWFQSNFVHFPDKKLPIDQIDDSIKVQIWYNTNDRYNEFTAVTHKRMGEKLLTGVEMTLRQPYHYKACPSTGENS